MKTIAIGMHRMWKRFTGWPRAALLEMTFMVLNDLFFVFIWYLAVQNKVIPGWGLPEAGLFLGSAMAGFAIAIILFGGLLNLQRVVDGTFDTYFLRPKSVWLQFATDTESISAAGDIFAGTFLLALTPYPFWAKIFTVASVAGIFVASATAVAGLFIGLRALSHNVFRDIHEIGFMQAVWPSHVIDDKWLRLIFVFIIPGLLYVTLPIEVLRGESPVWPLLAGYAVWTIVPIVIWKWGIKRYTGVSGIGWMGT